MGRPLKIAKQETGGTLHDVGIPGGAYQLGVVGGDTTIAGYQVVVRVKIGANAEADGYILRQKGRHKFRVSDGTHEGTCTLVDLADGALTADTMTISFTDAGSSLQRASRISNRFIWNFSNDRFYASMEQTDGSTAITAGPGNQPIVQVNAA